jgi:hypothetical protein
VLKLADQPRLADAGFTSEQDEQRTPGVGLPGGELQLRELADPPH